MVWNTKNTDPFWRCSTLYHQLCLNIFLFLVTREFHKKKEVWIKFLEAKKYCYIYSLFWIVLATALCSWRHLKHWHWLREKGDRSAVPWSPRTHDFNIHGHWSASLVARTEGTAVQAYHNICVPNTLHRHLASLRAKIDNKCLPFSTVSRIYAVPHARSRRGQNS